MKNFSFYQQLDQMDCGPTCLRMVAKHYGRGYSVARLRELCEIGKEGVNLLGIAQAGEAIGFKTLAVRVTFDKLITEAPLPCIVHWGQNHFAVVYDIRPRSSRWLGQIWGGRSAKSEALPTSNLTPKTRENSRSIVHVADPATGLVEYTQAEFESKWISTASENEGVGIALLLEPTPRLLNSDAETPTESTATKVGFGQLWGYFWKYKSLFVQLCLGLLVGSLLQLIMPFLAQSVVDTGIQTRNLGFITLVLVAQVLIFVGRTSVELIRSWILLHISTRINLAIISDFLAKLLRLPLSFFDSKMTGDILQRIGDHSRIEQFLTGTSLNMLFSIFNLLIFSVVLGYYNLTIFGVFAFASVLYVGWVLFFLGYRRKLDGKRFALASQNQSSLIQLITGIQEINRSGEPSE